MLTCRKSFKLFSGTFKHIPVWTELPVSDSHMARARYTLLSISNNGIVRVESDISYPGHILYFYRHFKTNTISQQRITQGNGSYSLSYKCCVNQKSTASIHVELFWQSLNCARPSASLIVLNILIRTLHISRQKHYAWLIQGP